MEKENWGYVVGIAGSLLGIVFSYLALLRGRKQDNRQEGQQTGTVLTELGYIRGGVDDIKRKQEKQDDAMLHLSCELESVKESTKSAHKRIDKLEENRIGVEHHE